jgi:small conductance mechanosensitive channel
LLILLIGLQLAKFAGRAILRRANADTAHGDAEERIQRAETLVLVFRKAAAITLWSICIVAILGELGVNTTALAATLGLLGIAVSLGSQGLVKDFVSGFFMLLENQLAIGDVISINGSISGTVEHFGMRVTVLRDGSGALHFIPNGSISRVSNQTHGYSKTVFTIGAGYREDPDEVIEVIEEVLGKFAKEADWANMILDAPVVLGVDSLGESEVSFKISIKVAPGKQWGIRRELLKRLKIAFDLNDIEMPFPQRVHYTESEQPVSKTITRRQNV